MARYIPAADEHSVRLVLKVEDDSSRAFKVVRPDSPALKLYNSVWGGGLESIFTRRPFGEAHPQIQGSPSHIWSFQRPEFMGSGPAEYFVRGEYIRAYEYIYNPPGPESYSECDEDATTEPFPDLLDRLTAVIEANVPLPVDHRKLSLSALAVTGQPGIGKTVYSTFLLLVRLFQKQEVAFVVSKDLIFLFKDDGVYQFKESDLYNITENSHALLQHTWCLVDCNHDTPAVSMALVRSFPFIIQTASTRDDHLHWMKYSVNAICFYMAAWTITEILVWYSIDRTLQKKITMEQLRYFYKTWGPSPQDARLYANSSGLYEQTATENICATVRSVAWFRWALRNKDRLYARDEISPRIVLIVPTGDLGAPSYRITTPDVLKLCLGVLHEEFGEM
ncbi:hypothetical protein OF83DRAFT_1143875 [Amylostereum chailletii]|nr:hypothetical protein OF83DRAFT_1143875 [Amylostereum chailletii]